MGVTIRTRFANLGRTEPEQTQELNRAEVQSALDLLSAYDPAPRSDRRRPVSSRPALRGRVSMWRR
jgi:hypothetical protein